MDDAFLDELYAAPLDEFIARRTALAKQLKADGRGDEAAEVASLRKPPVPLWAVNQLARRNRPAVDALLDASGELRQAIGKGDREAFGTAQKNQGDALRRLRDAARRLLDKPTDPTLARVVDTFRAASVDEGLREQLAAGRLTEEPEAGGFDALAGLTFSAPRRGRAQRSKQSDDGRAKARAALTEARKRHRELERAAQKAERDAERARAAADEADEAVRAAEAALEQAAG